MVLLAAHRARARGSRPRHTQARVPQPDCPGVGLRGRGGSVMGPAASRVGRAARRGGPAGSNSPWRRVRRRIHRARVVRVGALVADPERLVRFAARQTKVDPLAPRTTDEQRLFAVLAVTAGLCEEFLYRGFALWYFTSLAGAVAGFALAAVLFGLAHLYLGRMHVVRAAIVGAVFGMLVIGTGSLWLAIVLHVAMDLIGGAVGGRAFRAAEQHAATGVTPVA